MELNEQDHVRLKKGLSALIWCLSILMCALLVAFAVVGTGFFRIMNFRIVDSNPSGIETTLPDSTLAPSSTESWVATASPEPAITSESDISTPAPIKDSESPKAELNVQGNDQMVLFSSIPDVVEAASGSVVGIIQYQTNTRTGKLEEYASGSGFFVSESGYILTNAHVVNGAAAVDVLLSNGEKLSALVIGADVTTDIAVIKVEGNDYPALSIGDSNALRVGEYVIAIGNPLSAYELYGTVTFGIISATAREINIDGFVNTYLQTDAAINFGNSGGPLINMYGQVVGMNTAKSITAGYDSRGNTISAEGIGFALPIQNVIEVANIILRDGGMIRPGIGVQIRAIDEETAAENNVPIGCRIEELTAGAPAEQAGLKVGDIITKADDILVNINDDIVNYVRSLNVGDLIEFTVYREGEYITVTVRIGDMNKFSD